MCLRPSIERSLGNFGCYKHRFEFNHCLEVPSTFSLDIPFGGTQEDRHCCLEMSNLKLTLKNKPSHFLCKKIIHLDLKSSLLLLNDLFVASETSFFVFFDDDGDDDDDAVDDGNV